MNLLRKATGIVVGALGLVVVSLMPAAAAVFDWRVVGGGGALTITDAGPSIPMSSQTRISDWRVVGN